jgi:hypothetical protein
MVLATGAMAIATAAIYHVSFTAFGAFIDRSAVMISAAIDDGIDDFTMFPGHGIIEPMDVLGRVCLEDVFNRCHGHLLSSGR